MPPIDLGKKPSLQYDYSAIPSCGPVCARSCLTVVLDLDETLIRTFDPNEKIPVSKNHPDYFSFYIKGDLYEGVKRPGLDWFISKLWRTASKVIVFTAAKPEYAKEIVKIVFSKSTHKPDHVFTYVDCERLNNNIQKPLKLIFEKFPGEIDPKRLIVLDDKKCVYGSMDNKNIAQVKPFKGDLNDTVLRDAYYSIKYLWRKEKDILSHEIKQLLQM